MAGAEGVRARRDRCDGERRKQHRVGSDAKGPLGTLVLRSQWVLGGEERVSEVVAPEVATEDLYGALEGVADAAGVEDL